MASGLVCSKILEVFEHFGERLQVDARAARKSPIESCDSGAGELHYGRPIEHRSSSLGSNLKQDRTEERHVRFY